ncbi:hypothetical protein F2Q70_00002744 [Brassica cretica]|uniref:Uncharacterized protein n=1 Tax=Brassica cretica TaxID=69181 RepID=A0A8S9IWX1_BRACR|nr:hypothetical protein F2Q70_00002744 [Brassica cretica]
MTTTSSDKPRAESIDAAHQTSIDDTPPEAGKFPLTNNANKEVVLGEPKGQLSNAVNQIINEQETEIPVKINPISERDHETKLHLQDYLNLAEPIPIERERRVDSVDKSPLAKIKESLDSLHSALEGQNQFGIYQIDDDTLSELEKRVDFVDNPTSKDRYSIPSPDSFTQNYDATVGSRRGRRKFRLNQAFMGNRKMATDLNRKIDMIYSELMRKFDALSEHIKRLDGQVAENAIAIKRETGHLPGRTDENPKHQINVVSLRSGRSHNLNTIKINQVEKHADFEKTGENRSRPIILDGPTPSLKHRGKVSGPTPRMQPSISRRRVRNRSTRRN